MKHLLTVLLSCAFSALIAQTPGPHNMLDFNGTNTYVDCGVIDLNGPEITLATWVRVDAFKSSFPYITSVIGVEGPPDEAMIRVGDAAIPSNIVQFVLRVNGASEKLEANTALVANRWYHLACTYDGAEMKLYINGELDASKNASGAIECNEFFTLGRNYGNDRVLDGKLDEAQVWTTALSQSTIRDWMCKKITSSHPDYANLEGYWRMDEGTGTTVADLSGNGHTGTFSGTPQWQTSAAPVGDESMHDYSAPYATSLAHPSGGTFGALTLSSAARLLHVYRVDEAPNNTVLPAGIDTSQSDHYWGVFSAGTSGNIALDYTYNYSGVALFQPSYDCNANIIVRDHAASSSWSQSSNVSNDGVNELLSSAAVTRQEVWIARADSFEFGVSGPLEFCNGDSVILTASVGSGFTISSQDWFSNGTLITGANTSDLTVFDPATYSASATTSSGCIAHFLPVQVVTDPGIVTVPSLGPFCEEDAPVTLTGGTPSNGFYKVNGSFSSTFNPGLTGAGMHSLRYIAFGTGFGCTDSAETQVLVNASPNAELDLDTSLCENEVLALDMGTPAGGVYSGTGVSGTEFDAASSGAGFFEVYYSLTSTEGCVGADTGFVTVNLLPNPPVVSFSSGSVVSNKITGNQWYLNGNIVPGATNPLYTPASNGNVQATYTDDNGCTSALSEVFVFVGTAEIANGQFRLYPNPANGTLNVRANKPVTSIEIVDLQGRVVLHQTGMAQQMTLDLSGIATGAYQVQVTSGEAHYAERLLIQR